jgi:hypothetical protein
MNSRKLELSAPVLMSIASATANSGIDLLDSMERYKLAFLRFIFYLSRSKVGRGLGRWVLCTKNKIRGEMAMHFVLAWEAKTAFPKKNEIEAALQLAITGRSFVPVLSNVYVVKVDSQLEADSIFELLLAVGKKYTSEVNFIMSPLMNGGTYKGWLPKNLWPEIQTRTK